MPAGSTELSRVLRSRRLLRVELAFLGFGVAEYGVWTTMLVFAYGRGGATTAALVAVVQLVPAAIVAPFAAGLTDRHGGGYALRLGYTIQAAAMAGTAAVLLVHGPALDAYGMAAAAACAVTLTRPAQASMLVTLVERADELTAATVVSGWVESASVLAGPGLAGVLLAIGGPGTAFAVFAAGVAGSRILVAPLSARRPHDPTRADRLGGIRALRSAPPSRGVVAVIAIEYVAIGAIDVLAVVLAIAVLGLGPSGAGYLTAAFGAGGVAGAAAALTLVGARTLALPLIGAALGWAAAMALLATVDTEAPAYGLLLVAGAFRIVLDTAGRTLLARVTPHDVLGRVFGVLEGLGTAGLAAGSLLVPALIALGGVSAAVGGVAAILTLAALPLLPHRRALDRTVPPAGALRVLRRNRLFAGLSPPMLEDIARELAARPTRAGETIVRQGEAGDRFFLIADGELEVWKGGARVAVLGPGDGFGEIALLRNVPRQATVVTREAGLLYGLDREPFLQALAPAI